MSQRVDQQLGTYFDAMIVASTDKVKSRHDRRASKCINVFPA